MRLFRTGFGLLAAILIFSPQLGCLSLSREAPKKRFFMPRVVRPSEVVGQVGASVLRVEPCQVSPAFDRASMVYEVAPGEYSDDFYHEFFVLPSDWLRQAVTEWWAASGLFELVTAGGSMVRPELSWETRVSSLLVDLTDPSAPVARVELRGVLLREQKVLIQVGGTFSEPMADDSAEAGVAALGQALARAMAEWEQVLRERAAEWQAP